MYIKVPKAVTANNTYRNELKGSLVYTHTYKYGK